VSLPDAAYRAEEIGLAGSGRGAAYIHAGDRPGWGVEEDRRASGEAPTVGGMPNEHARDVAEIT
jgi:hypothetical protein